MMLPIGAPKLEEYETIDDGRLDYEITFCHNFLSLVFNGVLKNVPESTINFMKDRIKRAEQELERRHLLS